MIWGANTGRQGLTRIPDPLDSSSQAFLSLSEEDKVKTQKIFCKNSKIIHLPEKFKQMNIELGCGLATTFCIDSNGGNDKDYKFADSILPPISPSKSRSSSF